MGNFVASVNMRTLRESNPHLAKMSRDEIRDDLRRRAYESSVFEGIRLRRDHPAVLLSKDSRKKASKAR